MFTFKQFIVHDDRCAMKVGTDGVLLGAWVASFIKPETLGPETLRILDIGTGSGLIALILAQKYHSQNLLTSTEDSPKRDRTLTEHIDAIDIDPDAIAQASENFANSPFSHLLHAHHSSLQDWADSERHPHLSSIIHQPYSLIVSNPPYFIDSLKNPDPTRQTARHTDTLSYEDLISCSYTLLCEGGHLALILPAEAESSIIDLAQKTGFSLLKMCRVFGSPRKPAKRILIWFQKGKSSAQTIESLVLCAPDGSRSKAYSDLCKDYYL